jgi:hypothetical protein
MQSKNQNSRKQENNILQCLGDEEHMGVIHGLRQGKTTNNVH